MQLALLAAPEPEPVSVADTLPGDWTDIGAWFSGDTDERPACLPVHVGSTREVALPCGCRRRERFGAVGWLPAGMAKVCALAPRCS